MSCKTFIILKIQSPRWREGCKNSSPWLVYDSHWAVLGNELFCVTQQGEKSQGSLRSRAAKLSPLTCHGHHLEMWHPQTHLHTILSHGPFQQPWGTCFPATSGKVWIFCHLVISSPPRPVVHMFWGEAFLLDTGRIYDTNWAAVLPSGENNPPKLQSSRGRF